MKTIELTEAEKTLLRAADYIEKRGWCQNIDEMEDGRVCALRALSCVAGHVVAAAEELERRIKRDLVHWNDDPNRTKEEVIATMRTIEFKPPIGD